MSAELAILLIVFGAVLVIAARTRLGASRQPFGRVSRATTHFVPIQDLDALDGWWARSEGEAVLLFLHDPSCPISARAYRQVAQLGGTVPLIDVRSGRQLSRSVEARTGVRHESPQVIALRHGQARWSASHYGVTIEAMAAALQGCL